MQNSLIINPEPYVKRSVYVASLRKDIKSILLTRQKLNCPICSKPLIEWSSIVNSGYLKLENLLDQLQPRSVVASESRGGTAVDSVTRGSNYHENIKGISKNIDLSKLDPIVYNSRTINLLDSRASS